MQSMGAKCTEQDLYPLEMDEEHRLTVEDKKEILKNFSPTIQMPKRKTA